jgi:hypothetical protein
VPKRWIIESAGTVGAASAGGGRCRLRLEDKDNGLDVTLKTMYSSPQEARDAVESRGDGGKEKGWKHAEVIDNC